MLQITRVDKREKFAKLKDNRRRLVELVDGLLQLVAPPETYEFQLDAAILLIDTTIGDAQSAGIDYSSVIR